MGGYMQQQGYRTYAFVPSLFQHIGTHTSSPKRAKSRVKKAGVAAHLKWFKDSRSFVGEGPETEAEKAVGTCEQSQWWGDSCFVGTGSVMEQWWRWRYPLP
jgi:hypothetical protein